MLSIFMVDFGVPRDLEGPMVGSCEHDNEPYGSIKYGEFIYQLSYYQLLKKVITTWSWFVEGIETL